MLYLLLLLLLLLLLVLLLLVRCSIHIVAVCPNAAAAEPAAKILTHQKLSTCFSALCTPVVLRRVMLSLGCVASVWGVGMVVGRSGRSVHSPHAVQPLLPASRFLQHHPPLPLSLFNTTANPASLDRSPQRQRTDKGALRCRDDPLHLEGAPLPESIQLLSQHVLGCVCGP